MRLDLTGAVRLQREHAAQLDEIAEELRRPYVDLVSEISAPFGTNLDWWVTPLASRNTYVCPLFRRLCQVVLAQRLTAAGSISEVVVDTPAMADLLRETLPSDVQVLSALTPTRWRLRVAATVVRRLVAALYSCSGRFFFSRLISSAARPPPRGAITLVDTFLYPESIQANTLIDRHYPGMMEELGEDERRRVYWAPVFYRLRNYARVFRRLRACRDNLLLAEDHLHLADYVFAVGHFLRGLRTLPDHGFLGMRVGPLLREAYAESFAGSGSIEGLLRYRFAMRLREAGVRLQRVVDWFENQEIDHGAVAGWRTFHPDTLVLGYQGFLASRNYLCMFPLETERALGLLPHRLVVMGPALADPAREFCPGLEVVTAPAFRFDTLWRLPADKPRHAGVVLLVSLPLDVGETRQILELVGSAIGGYADFDSWQVWIKPHPAFQRRVLEGGAGMRLLPDWTVVDGDLDGLLEQTDMFVGSASSACVQAVVHGVPAVVIGGRARPTLNSIPDWVGDVPWAVCHTADDLRETLVLYAQHDETMHEQCRKAGTTIRERLFQPMTRAAVLDFLGLQQPLGTTLH